MNVDPKDNAPSDTNPKDEQPATEPVEPVEPQFPQGMERRSLGNAKDAKTLESEENAGR